uniref:Uncharacterized protein n=1 Tax=Siphoviridae sp. ctM7c3 TaxID=2826257 RepID=A0A8S5LZX9_9CAUD|nr:MAG TPA: hypothetical protein [Siphoviridae sp. ctM7c3]
MQRAISTAALFTAVLCPHTRMRHVGARCVGSRLKHRLRKRGDNHAKAIGKCIRLSGSNCISGNSSSGRAS